MKLKKSKINDLVEYEELKGLDKQDKQFEASTYDMELYDTNVTIALGKPKEEFKEYNIIYFPIYLVLNDKVKSRIGIYELEYD